MNDKLFAFVYSKLESCLTFFLKIQAYSPSLPGDPLGKIIAHSCSKIRFSLPLQFLPTAYPTHPPHTFWLSCTVPWEIASSLRTVQLWGCLPRCGFGAFWYARNWCAMWSSSHSSLAQQCSVAWREAQLPQVATMVQSLSYPGNPQPPLFGSAVWHKAFIILHIYSKAPAGLESATLDDPYHILVPAADLSQGNYWP